MTEKTALLISYLDKQWSSIERLLDKLKSSVDSGIITEEFTIARGYYLHNLYCGFEEMFKEVAKNFENNIEDHSKYHRELLRKMNLDVYQIRPKLVSDEGFTVLDEIRKFRHIFRRGYEYELDGKRIVELSNMLINNWEIIANEKDSFRQFLVAMVASQ